MRTRQLDAVGERYESIVAPRHHHAVFSGLLELLSKLMSELEHDGFFGVPRRRDGSTVDAAVARIEHDQRPWIAVLILCVTLECGGGLAFSPILEGDVAQERV